METVTIKGEIIGETERAIRFRDRDGWESWLPRSQIHSLLKSPVIQDSITIPLWLAREKGFHE